MGAQLHKAACRALSICVGYLDKAAQIRDNKTVLMFDTAGMRTSYL